MVRTNVGEVTVLLVDGGGGEARWTAERVADAVVEAFRLLPLIAVYAPRAGRLKAALPGQSGRALDILATAEHVLGRGSDEHRALLVWGRAKATGGEVGGSVSEYCRAAGLPRQTFDRRWRRACERIAVALSTA